MSIRSIASLILSCAVALEAQSAAVTNGPVRALSLAEAIQMSVSHSLALQIERYTPEMAGYAVGAAYGYYDPAFTFSGRQDFRSSPGAFDPRLGTFTTPNESWTESFASGLTGYAATGLRYELFATLGRNSGEFSFTSATNPTPFLIDRPFEYRSQVGINFTQPLLKNFWADAGRTKIRISKSDLKISEQGLTFALMDTVARVQQAYYELIAARDDIGVKQKAVELAQRVASDTRKKVEVGTEASLAEKLAESQAATARSDLLTARNNAARAENALKNLLTDNYGPLHDTVLEPTEGLVRVPETFNRAESWTAGLQRRPDYQQLKEELEKQNILLRFDHNQLFPQLDLVGTVLRNGLSDTLGGTADRVRGGDNPGWGGGGVLTVPLTLKAERNNYKLRKAAQKQAVLRLKKLEQDILVQIDDAVNQAQSDFDRIDATRQARIYAEDALRAEEIKLQNGKSTITEVLRVQRDLTAARSAEIRALADYNKSLSGLYFKEGTTLERNRISVQTR